MDWTRRGSERLLAVLVALVLVACGGGMSRSEAPPPAVAFSDSTPGAPPALVTLAQFFGNRANIWGYKVSPDGSRLGWIGSHRSRATIFFRATSGGEVGIVDTHSPRSVFGFEWTADSRRVVYTQDAEGDERSHVFVTSTDAPDARPVDLTPWEGATSWVARLLRDDPDRIIVSSNRRDRTVFDLYRIDLGNGETTLVAENPGDVEDWLVDGGGRPRARLRHASPTERHLEVFRDGRWTRLQTFELEEFDAHMLGMTPDDRAMWLRSGRGRDRTAFVKVDLETGRETVVYEHPELDVEWVTLDWQRQGPVAAFVSPGYPEVHFFRADLATAVAPLRTGTHAGVRVLSLDARGQRATVETFTERMREYFLVEPGRDPVRLGQSASSAFADRLGTTEPVVIRARDGVRLRGYVTRPPGFQTPGPMVLHVHGGHWARDYWGYEAPIQFLANRGYAVLQINYRGSTGYGRRFRELAVGEYAGKMHDDLIDGVRWAVDVGLADPKRVAIYGGSYGGYSALVGMTFTPDVFACGVSVVGMSNLVTLLESAPPHWKLWMPLFHKYVGDPRRPEDRPRLEAKSPLFRARDVTRPVLIIHGARDERVKLRESEQMVEALQRAGKTVRFVVLSDEGHRRTYGNWRNLIRHYREVEVFLGQCLGGRVGPEPSP
ncbi:MAG TPA: S9 family peptidase [Methylomirabilota bacterium]|jgi:dipeptidyl aminopeptidase/acylaminoacyl peptidase